MIGVTTQELRSLLKGQGRLRLGCEALGKLSVGELGKEQPDLQWLYDCAMEKGNSRGTFLGDPYTLHFTNAGTCTLGIVCEVTFGSQSIPQRVLVKAAEGENVYPEDMAGIEPAFVDVYYDEFCYESEEET